MHRFVSLSAGDPAPGFAQKSPTNPRFTFDSAAGRYLVLCFLHDSTTPAARRAIAAAIARSDLFDDDFASFFGVATAPEDQTEGRLANRVPGHRYFLDGDLKVSRLYGAATPAGDGEAVLRGLWVVIDPTMRIVAAEPLAGDDAGIAAHLARLAALPPPARFAGIELQAPILYLPRVFEPELCRELIARYEAEGGEPSGYMRDVGGRTVGHHDRLHKSRRDVTIVEPELIATLQRRILRRVVPEIAKVHQFNVTRMERYLVACYAADEGGHFAPHRDNTTPGTAHRRFAVSVNLNEDFEGGAISFPEYGRRGFKAPAGGAVVFSCSLLHAVSQVTSGRRYAFLPFLYDDAAAVVRDANRASIG